jgi:hypothetical protein
VVYWNSILNLTNRADFEAAPAAGAQLMRR